MQKLRTTPALKRTLKCLGLFGILMLCITLPAQAQWKWRDAAGKLQFSDLPPPQGTAEKDILQRPKNQQPQRVVIMPYGVSASAASAPSAVVSGPSKAEAERQAREKQQEKETLAIQKANEVKLAEQRRDNCLRAKENLKLLQDGVRLTRQNEKGEPIVVDERQRAEEMQRTRSVMESECR